jgi:hypothetical protein
MVPLGDEAQLESRFDPFRQNANLDASGCKVCVECTIGSKIVLDGPDRTPR